MFDSKHLTYEHMEKNRQATRLVKDFPREKENIVLIETQISTKNETKNKEKVILDFSSSKPINNKHLIGQLFSFYNCNLTVSIEKNNMLSIK